MKKIILLLLVLFILLSRLKSQESIVRIKVTGSQQNTISYTSNINEFFHQSLNQPEVTSTLSFNTEISIPIYQITETFFELRINNERGAIITISPGDSITIIFERDELVNSRGIRNYSVSFEGSNAIAHKIYRERFNPIAKNFAAINSAIEKSNNVFSFFRLTDSVINQKLVIWDSLKTKKLINEYCYNLYYNDTKAAMYRNVLKNIPALKKYYDSLSWNKQLKELKSEFFLKAKANNKYLLKTFVGRALYDDFLNYKVINDSTINDTLLKSIYESYYYLYDSSYREKAWGASVLYPALKSPFNELQGDKTNAIVFSKYYPNSIYLKKLNAIYDSIRTVRKKNSVYQEINTSPYSSIKEISSLYNERFYFVDAWASWCAPCISEFAYTRDLEIQLDSMKIKKIYLSIDEQKDSTTWKDLIKKYYLNGSHFLVGKDIQIEILKSLVNKSQSGGLSIPQYFVYDKLKNQFYMNLSRPSSGIILYEELRKIVKSKN